MLNKFSGNSRKSAWVMWGLQALLLITAVCIFVPFFPKMPGEGLDASWIFGTNQAVAQGLAFGREIITNFGPYAFIYTKTYHPFTDHLMLAGGLYLSVSYWIAFFVLTNDSRWYLQFVFWMALAGFIYTPDAVLASYPLLAGLFCFKLVNSQHKMVSSNKVALALTVIVLFPFGMLALIKGSLLILCASIAAIAFVLLAIHKRWGLAIAVAASPILSILFFWVASGQSILDLPAFFITMTGVISGYTEAMAVNGSEKQIVVYLIAALVLLGAILFEESIAPKSRIFLFCTFFVFLFFAFKQGFVRHDAHAAAAATSILIAALLFSLTLMSRRITVALFVSAFACMYIVSQYVQNVGAATWTEAFFGSISFTYSSAWTGLKNRLAKKNWLENDFDNALRNLKEKANFPLLQGTTDIYSYNQSYLIASGNIWNPRPMPQSCTAYTPLLVDKNKQHLLGAKAPDNVVFKMEPIDGRTPSIEDGASWPVLLTHYQPTAFENGFLYLRKRASKPEAPELVPLDSGIHAFGDVVAVPNVRMVIFAEISISQSLFGRIANILFKPTQLQISLNLENGTTKRYRIIAEMVGSGFIISPLVENTSEFRLLYADKSYLAGKRVKSFSITPVGGRILWLDSYRIAFKQIVMAPSIDVLTLLFDGIVDGATIH